MRLSDREKYFRHQRGTLTSDDLIAIRKAEAQQANVARIKANKARAAATKGPALPFADEDEA